MILQHRVGAAALAVALVVSATGCQENQQQRPKPPAANKPDAGHMKPSAPAAPARDAGASDAPAGGPDAAADAGAPPAKPPTTGTGGTSPPTTGTGGTAAPPATTGHGGTGGTGGSTAPHPATGTGGSAAMPPPTRPATALRIAAIGDYGVDNSDEGDVADLVHGWKPDHVITLGDNNYSSGEASTIDKNIGKYYHAFIGNYRGSYGAGSATNRFWPSPGNHDWVATDLKPYTDYFTLPGNERYYDVDLGLVHLYAIDSDGDEPDGVKANSKQALWLKERLAASTACFDLVYFHHPPLSSGDHGNDPDMAWPFETWGAEAVLAGHEHDYERFQVGGIPYFVNGMGAAGIREFVRSALPETKFRYDAKHGAMLITATATGITFEFWSHDGQKIDSLIVPKTCP
jgi:hypothetical protein